MKRLTDGSVSCSLCVYTQFHRIHAREYEDFRKSRELAQ